MTENGYISRNSIARRKSLIRHCASVSACDRACDGRAGNGLRLLRYKRLLAEAVDETKRLELIEIMIRENARDRLEAQRAADRVAMTALTVARVLGPSRGGHRQDIATTSE